MKNNKLTFTTIASLLFSLSVGAQQQLEQLNTRPKIADVLEYHESYKSEPNIPMRGGRLNFDYFAKAIAESAPQFIAQLEKAYPEATFAFIGRDTQVLSDVVDAFYQSIGQKGRVVQIGISSPTLEGLTDAEVELYLKNYGLNLENISPNKPFIFVDTISKGDIIDGARISGRQGRRLLQGLFQGWMNKGNIAKDFLTRVNIIGLRVSTFRTDDPDNLKRYRDVSEVKEINALNENAVATGADLSKFGRNLVIPLIKDSANLFNEAGYDHYTGAWHDKYQKPTKTTDGLAPNPGAVKDISIRKSILWLQNQIIDIVGTKIFRKQVKAEAEKLGVEFKNFRTSQTLVSCKNVYK